MKEKSSIATALCKSLGVNKVTFKGDILFGEKPGLHIYTIDGYYEYLTDEEYLNSKLKNNK